MSELMKQIYSTKMVRLALPILIATSLLLVLTAAASADSTRVDWRGAGLVVYVGPSQDPATPTTSEAKYKLKRNGEVQSVLIRTTNEQLAAVLGGGPDGGAITECRAREGSNVCDDLNAILTGSVLMSLHNSTAMLGHITQGEIQVPIQTPLGPVVLNVPVLSGSLRGKLQG